MYQPIVEVEKDPETGRDRIHSLALEALLRSVPSGATSSAPADFLSRLDTESRLGLFDWVLGSTMNDLSSLHGDVFRKDQVERCPLRYVSVNVEADAIMAPGFKAVLRERLQKAPAWFQPRQLVLEFLESIPSIEVLDRVSTIREELRKSGIQLAIDDFGEHFNGFAQIRSLMPDILKIGGTYSRAVESGHRHDIAYSQAAIHMCHSLDMDCVAEGVETDVQYNILRKLGVKKFQGFLLGKAMRIEEIDAWLQKIWTSHPQESLEAMILS